MTITDQVGNLLNFDQTPQRIVSLVPSQTELLVDMGLREQVVGITKFCVHPENLRKKKTVVGGTKQVYYDKIRALYPDIILCNKEENTKEMVFELQKIAAVHVSDIKTVKDSLELINQYGEIFNAGAVSSEIIYKIKTEQTRFRESATNSLLSKKVGYFIWNDPLMVAGGDTFINSLLEEIGFENAFKYKEARYPEIQVTELKDLDYVLLSSEPFPFKQKHIELFSQFTSAQVVLVDGEFFSWYGSRLIKSYPYFKEILKELEL